MVYQINGSFSLNYLLLIFSPGTKPDITNCGMIVKISIYGNGLIAGGAIFCTHHVFIVLETERRIFKLLEVEKCGNGKININMGTSKSLAEVINTRLNRQEKATFWRSDSVNISPLVVQKVIDEYHGYAYHPTRKSCRTFVDKICSVCKSNIRCVMPNEWWSFWWFHQSIGYY